MSTRGRPKVPGSVRLLNGTYRQYQDNTIDNLIEKTDGLPDPPAFIKDKANTELHDTWYSVCKMLFDLNILFKHSIPQIGRLVKFMYIYNKAFDMILAEGVTAYDGKGSLKVHPAVGIMTKVSPIISSLEKQMGLTNLTIAKLGSTQNNEGPARPMHPSQSDNPFMLEIPSEPDTQE